MNRRYSQFKEKKISDGGKAPALKSGPSAGTQDLKETTGPFKPIGDEGSNSGFNRGVNFPVLKAYVKKSGI